MKYYIFSLLIFANITADSSKMEYLDLFIPQRKKIKHSSTQTITPIKETKDVATQTQKGWFDTVANYIPRKSILYSLVKGETKEFAMARTGATHTQLDGYLFHNKLSWFSRNKDNELLILLAIKSGNRKDYKMYADVLLNTVNQAKK